MAANNDNNDAGDDDVEIDEAQDILDAPVEKDDALGWDDPDADGADGTEFTGDVAELAREWVKTEYPVEDTNVTRGELIVNLQGDKQTVRMTLPDDPVLMSDTVEPEGSEPVAVGDMLFELADDRHGLGGTAWNMGDLWDVFDAFPATGRELIDQLKTSEEAWADARQMYDTATQSPDTPDKADAREKVIGALEIEREWMYVTDRSNEDYYDLRCWTPDDGWRVDAYQVVEQRMSEELGTRSTKAETNHVIHHLANRNPVHSDQLDAGDDSRTLIPFQNGVLPLESVELDDDGQYVEGSAELLDHDPEYLFTTRIDAEWDPDVAEFDVIDSFMRDIVGGKDLTPTTKETDVKTLWEFAGHSFFPRYAPQGFLMVIGEGGDGKTVWFNLVTEVLGEENVSGATLDAITSDKFSAAEVVDRKANIAADIGGTVQTDISDLKWMTGDDRSQIRPIRKAPFFDRNSATMMFGSNSPPAFTEKKRSLKRRLYPVRAPFEFHNDPDPDDPTQKQKRPKAELMGELTADAALAAVAVRMVEGARRLQLQDEWTLGLEMDEQERLEFYESEADALGDFTNVCIEPDPTGPGVALDDLEAGYDAFAVENDHPSKQRSTIKKEIERSRDIQLKRSYVRSWTDNDERIVVYKGIRFTEEAAKYLPEFAHWDKYDLENPHNDGEDDEPLTHSTQERTKIANLKRSDKGGLTTVEGEVLYREVKHNGVVTLTIEDETDAVEVLAHPNDGNKEYETVDKIDGIDTGDTVRFERVRVDSANLRVHPVTDVEVTARKSDITSYDSDSEEAVSADVEVIDDAKEPKRSDLAQHDRVMSVKDVVESVEDMAEDGAAVEEVLNRLEDRGIDPEKAEKELEKLLQKGEVYEVGAGRVRTT